MGGVLESTSTIHRPYSICMFKNFVPENHLNVEIKQHICNRALVELVSNTFRKCKLKQEAYNEAQEYASKTMSSILKWSVLVAMPPHRLNCTKCKSVAKARCGFSSVATCAKFMEIHQLERSSGKCISKFSVSGMVNGIDSQRTRKVLFVKSMYLLSYCKYVACRNSCFYVT